MCSVTWGPLWVVVLVPIASVRADEFAKNRTGYVWVDNLLERALKTSDRYHVNQAELDSAMLGKLQNLAVKSGSSVKPVSSPRASPTNQVVQRPIHRKRVVSKAERRKPFERTTQAPSFMSGEDQSRSRFAREFEELKKDSKDFAAVKGEIDRRQDAFQKRIAMNMGATAPIDIEIEKYTTGRKRKEEQKKSGSTMEQTSDVGFLKLGRLNDLNDMSQDFSEQLNKPVKLEENSPALVWQKSQYSAPNDKLLASQYEAPLPKPAKTSKSESKQIEADTRSFDEIKRDLVLTTLAGGIVGTAIAYAAYGKGVGVSFAVGSFASFIYIRSLTRFSESVGASGGLGGAVDAGSPRLLIPVILVLGFNRLSGTVAVKYGLDLNLFAILAGFFVDKLGIFAEVGRALATSDTTVTITTTSMSG